MGFPGSLVIKNPPANARDMGLIPGWGRSPREGNGNPLQYSCLGNPRDRGAWWATVHGVTKESDRTERVNNNKASFDRWGNQGTERWSHSWKASEVAHGGAGVTATWLQSPCPEGLYTSWPVSWLFQHRVLPPYLISLISMCWYLIADCLHFSLSGRVMYFFTFWFAICTSCVNCVLISFVAYWVESGHWF